MWITTSRDSLRDRVFIWTLVVAALRRADAAAETLIDSRGVDLIRKEVISAALRGPVGLPSSGALSLQPSTKRYQLFGMWARWPESRTVASRSRSAWRACSQRAQDSLGGFPVSLHRCAEVLIGLRDGVRALGPDGDIDRSTGGM